jgi:hypothetical protein
MWPSPRPTPPTARVIDDLLEEPTTGAPADAESVAGEHNADNADNAEGDGSDSQNGSGLDGASVWRGGSAQAWH